MDFMTLLDFDKGLNLKSPDSMLPVGYTVDCSNVRLKNGVISKREGYSLMGDNLPLQGSVMAFKYFTKADGSGCLVCMTTREAYVRDVEANSWNIITLLYQEGTVNVTQGSDRITGVNTFWTENISFGDVFMSVDGQEYTVHSVDSDTRITLSTPYRGESAIGTSYKIRRLHQCSLDDMWTFEVMHDMLIASNGVDPIMKYTGTGNFQLLGGQKYLAKFIKEFNNHLHLFNTIEEGNACPQRHRWSDTGNPEVWDRGNAGFVDLLDSEEPIMGVSLLGRHRLVIYKKNSIIGCRWIGSPYLFGYDENEVVGIGLLASKTLQTHLEYDIFLSQSGVYMYSGSGSPTLVSELVNDSLLNTLMPKYVTRAFGYMNVMQNEYWLFVCTEGDTPDLAWVLNISSGGWSKYKFRDIISLGSYVEEIFLSWDSVQVTWDDMEGRWDDVEIRDLSPVVLYGDKQGNVYRESEMYNEDVGRTLEVLGTQQIRIFNIVNQGLLQEIKPLMSCNGFRIKMNFVFDGNVQVELYEPTNSATAVEGEFKFDGMKLLHGRTVKVEHGTNIIEVTGVKLLANHMYGILFKGSEPRMQIVSASNTYIGGAIHHQQPDETWQLYRADDLLGEILFFNATGIWAHWCTPDLVTDERYIQMRNDWLLVQYEAKGDSLSIYYSVDKGVTWKSLKEQKLASTYRLYDALLRVHSPYIRFKFENSKVHENFDLRWIKVDYNKRCMR